MPTLDFKGKQHIYAHHLTVPYRPLVPHPDKSLNPAASDDNLIIHGDNLHALKALLPRYAGRVKCIYIDPPYNTGNEGWVYNDKVNSPLLKEWFKETEPVNGEDLERHDKWLCMMWPRLQLLKELLTDDGVIFVSIDDNEQHHLRMLMDEIFGPENFVADIAVVSNLAGSSDQFAFAGAHEDCLVYAKSKSEVSFGRFQVSEDALAEWSHDEQGYYKPELLRRSSLTYSESLHYPIFVDNDGSIFITDDDKEPVSDGPYTAVYPITRNGKGIWRWSKRRIQDAPGDVFTERRTDGSIAIYSKQRPQLGDLPTEKPKSVFYKPEYSSRAGGQMLSQIFYDLPQEFPYPKALRLLTDLLGIATGPNAVVLDSFAGSGTTAHATLALNKEDGGNRKFILVECEAYADTITAERVRRVISGVPEARDKSLQEGLGGSFTYYTLGNPIDLEKMLTGEALPDYSSLAAYLLHTTAGISVGSAELAQQNEDGLFYSAADTDYYLLYQPDLAFLKSNAAMLNAERAGHIQAASYRDEDSGKGRKAVVYGSGKYLNVESLRALGITFCQLPYEMYRLGQ